MLDNLYKINISEECIDNLKNLVNNDILISLASNYEIINDNIKLLYSYGISNMEDLFLNKYFIFVKKTEDLVKKFSEFNIPVFIQMINEDCNMIDEML